MKLDVMDLIQVVFIAELYCFWSLRLYDKS